MYIVLVLNCIFYSKLFLPCFYFNVPIAQLSWLVSSCVDCIWQIELDTWTLSGQIINPAHKSLGLCREKNINSHFTATNLSVFESRPTKSVILSYDQLIEPCPFCCVSPFRSVLSLRVSECITHHVHFSPRLLSLSSRCLCSSTSPGAEHLRWVHVPQRLGERPQRR